MSIITKQGMMKLLAREPFVPFRVHLENGKRYDVPFREVGHVLSFGFLVFIGMKQGTRSAKGYDRFPFEKIIRIEENPAAVRRRRKAS